ncbi:MAG: hypothetical protein QG667_914 [Pseudomonadota bacterium]|jgi:hypothetical protein|nr:hypothetical protein [Pseudomonadota bacterium]
MSKGKVIFNHLISKNPQLRCFKVVCLAQTLQLFAFSRQKNASMPH